MDLERRREGKRERERGEGVDKKESERERERDRSEEERAALIHTSLASPAVTRLSFLLDAAGKEVAAEGQPQNQPGGVP